MKPRRRRGLQCRRRLPAGGGAELAADGGCWAGLAAHLVLRKTGNEADAAVGARTGRLTAGAADRVTTWWTEDMD
jgi:hypothetical protein